MQKQEVQAIIERVQQMERYFDEVSRVMELKSNELYENATIRKMIQELTEYMDSGLWLQDYECDERGELPTDLKRGVLSEDGLYNLLCDIEAERRKRKRIGGNAMKCPFCDVEMLHGYLNCGTTIWSERKHKISTLPDEKEKYALHLDVPMFSPHHVESDCCPKCKRIIVDSSRYENNLE